MNATSERPGPFRPVFVQPTFFLAPGILECVHVRLGIGDSPARELGSSRLGIAGGFECEHLPFGLQHLALCNLPGSELERRISYRQPAAGEAAIGSEWPRHRQSEGIPKDPKEALGIGGRREEVIDGNNKRRSRLGDLRLGAGFLVVVPLPIARGRGKRKRHQDGRDVEVLCHRILPS